MPKVSVIVPVYGVEKYIERCARSLFEQTLNDIEYIFVNDCTPDKSIDILKKILNIYPQRQDQVKVITMPQNSGQAAVRKTGILAATGDYIIHCDSDDWVDVTMYEKLYNKAIKTDADMVWCDFIRTDTQSSCIIQQKCETNRLSAVYAILRGNIMGSLCNKLFKKELYSNITYYPVGNMLEDTVISIQLLLHSKKIQYVPQSLYNYFINRNSISATTNEQKVLKRYDEYLENWNKLYKIVIQNNIQLTSELIVYRELLCKEQLNPLLGNSKYRQTFLNTFPEINDKIYHNNIIPLRSKIRFFLVKNDLLILYKLLWFTSH